MRRFVLEKFIACKPGDDNPVVGLARHHVVHRADHAAREGERVLEVEEEAEGQGGEGRASCGGSVLTQDFVCVNKDERDLLMC